MQNYTKLASPFHPIKIKTKTKLFTLVFHRFDSARLHVLPSSFDWFTELFVVIGYDDYFDYHQSKPSDNDQLHIEGELKSWRIFPEKKSNRILAEIR